MALSTENILQIALDLSGFSKPPADTAIYIPGRDLKSALVGIDMETPEILLAKQLGFDLVISHHPEGGEALLHFPDVLTRFIEMMESHGVPPGQAREAADPILYNARCNAHLANYDRAPSAARLLGIPYMNIHLPLDEIGRRRMEASAANLPEDATVRDLVEGFEEKLPEFRAAGTEIEIRVGARFQRLGRLAIVHGNGTNGGYPVARALFEHGVDTVVYIHCSGPDSKRLADEFQERRKNLVITGHMASDSLGVNPFVDELERRGMKVKCMSGVVRVPPSHREGA
jgi:putative NIF3 family GTP cyclohydrolase 1 type 2